MSYYTETIHDVIQKIDRRQIFLPAIQRKFVWKEDRITLLFDSILRGYPINTFLFWFLTPTKANDYVFYDFLTKYDDRDPFNKPTGKPFTGEDDIIGVLDGQQRLSSIYVGLKGSYTSKLKNKHFNNPHAWPERCLYINLLNTPYYIAAEEEYSQIRIDESENFDLKFLDPKSVKNSSVNEKCYWLPVGDLLKWRDNPSSDVIFDNLIEKESNDDVKTELSNNKKFVKQAISDLHRQFWEKPVINYYKTQKEDLEAILNIFVRVNSGAVTLSKSDLLFSTIIATWQDGRKEIEQLQNDLNEIGDGFSFSNDFLMRSLLVLSDLNVNFNVKSFNSDNVKEIKNNWESIKNSLITTVKLLSKKGLSGWLIPSQNAVIPIAYYINKGGILNENTESNLIQYLIHAFLKNIFSGQTDSILANLRNALRDDNHNLKDFEFSFQDFLNNLQLSANKELQIRDEDIDEILELKKGPHTFLVLSLLYRGFKYDQVKLHQDHIHPDSMFKNQNLEAIDMNGKTQEDLKQMKDMLPNLQLLEEGENKSKNDMPFNEWLEDLFSNLEDEEKAMAKRDFLTKNFIEMNTPLEFQNFVDFFEKRKDKIRQELKSRLIVSIEGKLT